MDIAVEIDRKKARIRLRFVLLFLGLWGLGIVVRLVDLQVVHHSQYKAMMIAQNQREVTIPGERGTIYARNREILAQTVPARSVFFSPVPGESLDLQLSAVRKAAAVLGLETRDMDRIRTELRKGSTFVYLKRKVDVEIAARVQALGLKGISAHDESRRFYPHGSLASHVLAGVDLDNRAIGGVELKYDPVLRGKEGRRLILLDSHQREYEDETIVAPESGRDITLTLDPVVQYLAETQLGKAVAEYRADWGAVIVLQPRTGEILAMASAPSFDLNDRRSAAPEAFFDRSIRTVFEPGSTFKVVTFAAAIENRRVATHEAFDCGPDAIKIAGGPIRDHKPFGILSFPDVFAQSSNIGTAQVGRRVGPDLLYRMIKAFRFGERTGVDLPAEEKGRVRPPNEWSGRSLESMSVGYEISVTALQIVQTLSVVANRGLYIPPRIVKAVDGRLLPPREGRSQVLTSQTAEKLIDLLERVVLKGTGTAALVEGYPVAGKTGTAQKFDTALRQFSTTRHVASFAGFVPADRPELAIVVVIDAPKKSEWEYYGGQVAAPVFREIAVRALRHLHVAPKPEAPSIVASRVEPEALR